MADTARQTSEAFGDLEFEYNLKQLLDKDPIAALGFDPAKASYSVPQGDKYGTKYSREEDTLFYGPDTGSSKDILVHEFRHRGHQLLRNEIEKNPEAFAKKYGQDVVDFLTGEFSETEGKLYPGDRQEEFRTELSDNLEATYNKPRPSEEKLLQGIKDSLGDSANLFNDEELMALAVKNYVKNVDNTGYLKDTTELVTKEDQEKYKNILTKVRQAAFDIIEQRKGMAEGGKVGNMNMQKQMSLFEYGGIADDGMTKDPVSGNNIPPGSLAKEVRDDIPAMLSEGEYVVPADVLRFYGVNFFENLRNQAKSGLQNMEQNGRIGGTPMTQQDVARNMQQPMMVPAPVQAAQGTMMQSPIRIQQQAAPQAMGNSGMQQQPVMANQGTMVQGFNQGPMPTAAQYRSSWTPAKARYSSPMFQGTSSQQANIETAQAEADTTAGQEITQSRKHYNQQGESAQVEYVGTDPSNMSIKQTEANLAIAAAYPLTEEEWLAYKKEMGRSDDGGNGGGETEPTGSSTDWMDGIDWNDQANVKEWADKTLGISKGSRELGQMGGIFGAAVMGAQANDIAKVRGALEYYKSIGDEDMVKYLEPAINKAVEEGGLLISALDKLGLMTGKTYLQQLKDLDPVIPGDVPGFQARVARQKAKVAEGAEAQKAADEAAAAAALKEAQSNQDDDDPFAVTDVSIDRDPMGQGTMTTTYEGIDPGLTTASFEEDPDIDFGVNKGGLMTTPKPKKKTRKYNKGGLAGKKK